MIKTFVKSRKKYRHVYIFVSFGLECPKTQKATDNTAHSGYLGDLDGLERD